MWRKSELKQSRQVYKTPYQFIKPSLIKIDPVLWALLKTILWISQSANC